VVAGSEVAVIVRVSVGVRAGPTGFLVLLGVTTGLAVGVGAHAWWPNDNTYGVIAAVGSSPA